jgi:hypothetical protein
MRRDACEIASRLADDAESACRHFLPAGRRSGNYWIVGDVFGNPGRSMFVRLKGRSGRKGGRWTDAATGDHGDLLDLIRQCMGLNSFGETLEEARRFLSMPMPESLRERSDKSPAPSRSSEAAKRLFAAAKPITGTLAELYLARREIPLPPDTRSLRFHERCWRRNEDGSSIAWPAMIAAVTDLSGQIQGVHRTWLARDQIAVDLDRGGNPFLGKAQFASPRRAMGNILGHAVRFGAPSRTMLAGEGIETVLSLHSIVPDLQAVAALSAGHLGAIILPEGLRRLYVALENDPESDAAFDRLVERGHAAGVDVIGLRPQFGDFNDDLRLLGSQAVRDRLRRQFEPEDAAIFLGDGGRQDR